MYICMCANVFLLNFFKQAFVKAVTSGVENVEEVLISPEYQKQIVPQGPRIVADKTKSFKTIDSENVQKRSLAQEDGKIITESKKTTEHEVIVDDNLPDNKSVKSAEQIKILVSYFNTSKKLGLLNFFSITGSKSKIF